MKKILLLLIVCLGLGGVILYGQQSHFSSCDQPIHFTIDKVDAQFHLSKSEFTGDAQRAADIWNKAYGKQLLVFDQHGSLDVNLLYDQRQQLDSQIAHLQNQVNQKENSLDPQIVQYKKDAAQFEAKVANLNAQIQSWNQKGGAPPDVYNQLLQQQQALQSEAQSLNARAAQLHVASVNVNSQISTLNQTIGAFNTALTDRPEEGIYLPDQNRIEIYFDITDTELVHTLAHEMGHALGLDHNPNKKSIMYAMTNQSLTPSAEDLSALHTACKPQDLLTFVAPKVRRWLVQMTRQQ